MSSASFALAAMPASKVSCTIASCNYQLIAYQLTLLLHHVFHVLTLLCDTCITIVVIIIIVIIIIIIIIMIA